jgi:hypothetical protein
MSDVLRLVYIGELYCVDVGEYANDSSQKPFKSCCLDSRGITLYNKRYFYASYLATHMLIAFLPVCRCKCSFSSTRIQGAPNNGKVCNTITLLVQFKQPYFTIQKAVKRPIVLILSFKDAFTLAISLVKLPLTLVLLALTF